MARPKQGASERRGECFPPLHVTQEDARRGKVNQAAGGSPLTEPGRWGAAGPGNRVGRQGIMGTLE